MHDQKRIDELLTFAPGWHKMSGAYILAQEVTRLRAEIERLEQYRIACERMKPGIERLRQLKVADYGDNVIESAANEIERLRCAIAPLQAIAEAHASMTLGDPHELANAGEHIASAVANALEAVKHNSQIALDKAREALEGGE